MDKYLLKIKLLLLPYLLVAVSYIFLYTFLNWLLVIKLELLSLNEDLVNIWLPYGLIWIPVLAILYRRTKILNLKTKRADLPGLYLFVATLAIAVPSIIAQIYLSTASGKLTVLNDINYIASKPPTKYYKLNNYFVEKNNAGVFQRFEVSGKNNEYLNFYIDVVCPIVSSGFQDLNSLSTAIKTPKAWLGVEFQKSVSNNLSNNEKDTAYKLFFAATNDEFKSLNFSHFVYFDKPANNNKSKGLIKAVNSLNKAINHPIILLGINESFENRNGDKLKWIFLSFGIGSLIWLVMILIPGINSKGLSNFLNPKTPIVNSNSKQWLSYLNPKSPCFITLIIISINVLMFVIMVFAGLGIVNFEGGDLLNWGANYRPAVLAGDWWRLLTCIFIHGGLMHLLGNMYGLIFVGILLEPKLGKVKYGAAYLICGIIASLTSIWWHPTSPGVGASGAIFGLYGVFTALLITNRADFKSMKFLLINNIIFVGLNLLLGLRGGVDNAAHLGGLASGFIIGFILYFFSEPPKPKRKYVRKKMKPNVNSFSENIEQG